MRKEVTSCTELIEKTANALDDDTLKLLFVSVQQNNVDVCIHYTMVMSATPSLNRDNTLTRTDRSEELSSNDEGKQSYWTSYELLLR